MELKLIRPLKLWYLKKRVGMITSVFEKTKNQLQYVTDELNKEVSLQQERIKALSNKSLELNAAVKRHETIIKNLNKLLNDEL